LSTPCPHGEAGREVSAHSMLIAHRAGILGLIGSNRSRAGCIVVYYSENDRIKTILEEYL
jgi:hypothetical protein